VRTAHVTHQALPLSPLRGGRWQSVRTHLTGAVDELSGTDEKPFGVDQVVEALARHGVDRSPVTVAHWLGQEARRREGAVVRVAPRTFARRTVPRAPAPPNEVLVALYALRTAGRDVVSVQDVIAQLRDDGVTLSQRSVYYRLQAFLDGAEPLVRRARWGHYSLTDCHRLPAETPSDLFASGP
jgi:hypothetical protein